MTENEKINGWTFEETIKCAENLMEVETNMFKWDVLRHLRDFTENYKEENQQYHALGTVEEIKTRFKNEDEAIKSAVGIVVDRNLLIRYQSIGTAEELEAANKYVQLAKKHRTVGKVIDACAEYEEIGTVEEFKALKEKAEPKKPITYQKTNRADCPVCGKTVRGIGKPFGDWCADCGQKLDWD